ncbi:S-adenosylmethionine:tRNA ribosyltransferase-isomerase [Sulfuriferula plumbiphila]|uniref:S-adenosylmethionine:tRNA ribosyltransferase-isomerase n=1 Tax=Sulfuriferula plumbiphila TaxID=171865 RepID=A0A512L895_9PROT|nr:tRNA preQ1(34) S-adenosylmethionine ribosyltransferase-isomerase QueA [Sulfuriferula plumbiphila]BBP05324.1 S-adenosylmethionine:tRNA ribosyltransferase-isomerase [Sulfuriferula plumbiphila]GEP30361.1 S-adenosylmethionine:tRNA ribosyltransferase-isomerase [Sulfuriferula plumbiphila]
MRTADFDFSLPAELIAQFPPSSRSSSRLLHLDSASGQLADCQFTDLPGYLRRGDVMVFNDTRVIKARLYGRKASGGQVELLIERVTGDHEALAFIRASHAPRPGSALSVADTVTVTVLAREQDLYRLRFDGSASVLEVLEQYGTLPLPPYIERAADGADDARYQTVYARHPGAVAAPTAGLHFDQAMLAQLDAMGVIRTHVTLHVGAGTFQPVRVDDLAEHTMHSERYTIPQATVDAIAQAKAQGGRIVAVGTTSLRALEAAAQSGTLIAGAGETSIFITPGYRFKVVERLLTNFHLPKSTLLMLVSAFAGLDNIRHAYAHAVTERYRFFSYGDAMLIERKYHEI